MAGNNKGDVITRKDIIEDEALNFGVKYAENVQTAIDKNTQFKKGILEIADAMKVMKGAYDNTALLKAKDDERVATLKNINAIKEMALAEKEIEKIKQEGLRTLKLEADLSAKVQRSQQVSVKLTIEERIQNEINNKALKQKAMDTMGLIGPYTKLNKARTDAKKVLLDLIATEGASTAAIVKAQAEFDKLDAKVKKANDAVRDFGNNVGNYPQIESLKDQLKDLVGAFGLVAGIGAFVSVLKGAFNTVKEFDQSIADLQAITGATGDDLDFLKNKAIELGKGTQDGAKGVVESYKLIASAKPELLANVEDLNKVTEAVITLSKASGMEMPAAATALTDAMNQFGADASQATIFIDALAAGAKFGSAEIPQITEALLKFGAVSRTANVSIQESTALVELLAENGLKGADAGTALRNVMLKLSAPDALPLKAKQAIEGLGISFADLSDTSKPIQERLEALKPLLNDNAGMVKVFGLENVVAATNILGHTERLKELTGQISEQGIAQEQATVRSNTLMAATDRLSSAWDSYILSQTEATGGTGFITQAMAYLGDNLETIMNVLVKLGAVWLTYLVTTKAVTVAMEIYKAIQLATTAGQIAFTTATGIGTIGMKAQAAAAAEATVATNALNVATKATPWGLIIALLLSATAAYAAFSDSIDKSRESMAKLKEETKRLQDQEAQTNKSGDEFRSKRIKQIEDEFDLKRKSGGNIAKLNAEEIAAKQKLLVDELEIYGQTKDFQIANTKNMIIESNKRIAQMAAEAKELAKGGFRVSKNGNTADDLSSKIGKEKESQKSLKNTLDENTKITIAEKTKLNNMLADLNRTEEGNTAEETQRTNKAAAEKSEKARKDAAEKAKKAREDLLAAMKQKDQDEYNLGQFRLQRAVELNKEILDDETKTNDERIGALMEINQLSMESSQAAAEQKLKDVSRYSDKIRDLSNEEIATLVNGGAIKKQLSNDEILILEELAAKKEDIAKKDKENIQKIIDSQVAKVEKSTANVVMDQDTEMKNALAAEDIKFKALTDGNADIAAATEDHERQIFEIKKLYAQKALDAQIAAIEAMLVANDLLPESERISADKRRDIDNKLAGFKQSSAALALTSFVDSASKEVLTTEEKNAKIIDLSKQIAGELINIANDQMQQKIDKIDEEITANEEYYNKQKELAGNDQAQKDLLQMEMEKKRDLLEKKKKKEQIKQFIFNKALALVEAGINTGKAITAALATTPPASFALAALTAGLAAVQLVAIAAAPIPKYKDGRIGGKKEMAMINDGGVAEVVERRDGKIEMFSEKNKIIQLLEGDTVHKSADSYNKTQQTMIMAGINGEGKKMANWQNNQGTKAKWDQEMIDEMRLTRKAIQAQKHKINNNINIDIPHAMWAAKNKNW